MSNNNQASYILRWIILVLAIIVLILLFSGQIRRVTNPNTSPGGGGQVNPPAGQAYIMTHPLWEGPGA